MKRAELSAVGRKGNLSLIKLFECCSDPLGDLPNCFAGTFTDTFKRHPRLSGDAYPDLLQALFDETIDSPLQFLGTVVTH